MTTINAGDELLFHFRELVKEKIVAGQSFDDAWNAAEENFGSLRRYEDECREIRLRDKLFPGRIAVGALVVMALMITWLSFEVRSVGHSGEVLAQTISATAGKPASNPLQNLSGQVLDKDDRPLKEARVLLILKTWPNDRYQQEDFDTVTDSDGRYRFEALVPASERHAVMVVAYKAGHAFRSKYDYVKRPTGKREDVNLQLPNANEVTLIIKNENGKPESGVEVRPSQRKPKSGEESVIYFQGSETLTSSSDDQGKVKLNCFEAGDQAEVYLKQADGEWQSKKFKVPAEGNVPISLP